MKKYLWPLVAVALIIGLFAAGHVATQHAGPTALAHFLKAHPLRDVDTHDNALQVYVPGDFHASSQAGGADLSLSYLNYDGQPTFQQINWYAVHGNDDDTYFFSCDMDLTTQQATLKTTYDIDEGQPGVEIERHYQVQANQLRQTSSVVTHQGVTAATVAMVKRDTAKFERSIDWAMQQGASPQVLKAYGQRVAKLFEAKKGQ